MRQSTTGSAFQKIAPHLPTHRDATFRVAWVEEQTGYPVARMDNKIRRHYDRLGLIVKRRDGVYRVLTAPEQLNELPRAKVQAKRALKRGYDRSITIDREELNAAELRIKEFNEELARRAMAQINGLINEVRTFRKLVENNSPPSEKREVPIAAQRDPIHHSWHKQPVDTQ